MEGGRPNGVRSLLRYLAASPPSSSFHASLEALFPVFLDGSERGERGGRDCWTDRPRDRRDGGIEGRELGREPKSSGGCEGGEVEADGRREARGAFGVSSFLAASAGTPCARERWPKRFDDTFLYTQSCVQVFLTGKYVSQIYSCPRILPCNVESSVRGRTAVCKNPTWARDRLLSSLERESVFRKRHLL